MTTPSHESMTSLMAVRAAHVSYTLGMVSEIAAEYDSVIASGHQLCADALLESFYINIRLLGEFLGRPTSNRDFGPDDFGVRWSTPDTDAARRLAVHWQEASTYIFHFGKPRTPSNLDDLDVVVHTGASLKAVAADALEVMASFVKEVISPADPSGSPGAVSILRISFTEACGRLGLSPEELLAAA